MASCGGLSTLLPGAVCKPQQADCQSAAGSQPAPQCIPPIRLRAPVYFFPKPMSLLRRLTIAEAMRSDSFDVAFFGSSYTDQTTSRDLVPTRNIVPLLRPTVELVAGFSSLFDGAIREPLASSSLSPSLGSVFSGGGGASMASNFSCSAAPTWSVRTASAIFGSVTMTKTCSVVRTLARYCSSPWAMRSEEHTSELQS